MDAIVRFERGRRRAIAGAMACLAVSLFALWLVHSEWQRRADNVDGQVARAIGLLEQIKANYPPPAASHGAIAVRSWIAGRAFESAKDDRCERLDDLKTPEQPDEAKRRVIGTCDWKWQPLGGAEGDPFSFILRAHQTGRPVIVIVTAGHDDQGLRRGTEREFGTNFNLAARRAGQLAKSLVHRATDAPGCDLTPTVHCVAIPQGAPAVKLQPKERAEARTPRVTIIVGA